VIVRTGYAFRQAIGKLDEVLSRLQEVGATSIAVADTFSTYGFVNITKAAKKYDLKVIYGVELLVVSEIGRRRQGIDYWTFLAKDSLEPLHQLISQASLNTGSEPCLTYEQALQAEGVVKVMCHAAVPNLVQPASDLFLGLSPASSRGQVAAMMNKGIPLLARSDNHYPREDDLELYRVALGRNASSQTYPMHILSDEEWRRSLSWVPEAILECALDNRGTALEMCHATLRKAELLIPEKPKSLRQLCLEGAERVGCDLSRPEYQARMDRELAMISEKNYADYFHIVSDIMQFARDHMVVGPARGSSCGSLVCYLLGITSIDPIPFNLVFERFIDVTRKDLPDIDVDLSEKNRHLVFDYMAKKYGEHRVARMGSVNMFKAKAALNQVGMSLRIPKSRINEVTNTVIKRSGGDARVSSTIEDALNDTDVGQRFLKDYPEARIVQRMEGHPSVAAQHAAGMVITDLPVTTYVAVNRRTGATMCDKRDAEELNLLKIDALGLTQLSIFERCLELIGRKPRNDYLEAIPLDDPAAFQVLNDKKFSGIFQFVPGAATVDLIRQIHDLGGQLNHINDLVALTAIVRPGPLKSGQAVEWIKRRVGHHQVSHSHESLEPYLRDTLGLILYQEQILNIGREIGGLSWDDVTALRKAMSKSLGREYFSQFGDRWIAGAMEKVNMPKSIAQTVFDSMCSYGSWAFNLSHSVAYGVVSYWCCWLKAHHPLEFSAATLDSQKDPYQQIETLRELRTEGISYTPVDPQISVSTWGIDREAGRLVGPISNVIGIGPRKQIEILDSRENGTELKPALRKLLERARTPIDSLEPIHDAIQLCNPKTRGIVTSPIPISQIIPGSYVCVFGLVTRVSPGDENDPHKISMRGYAVSGCSSVVQFWIRDDTAEIFCKISRHEFNRLGPKFISQARVNKSLFAVKGWSPTGDFRMIRVEAVRYIGEMDGSIIDLEAHQPSSQEEEGSGATQRQQKSLELVG
jgi:DNA polymerase III alpha subunit